MNKKLQSVWDEMKAYKEAMSDNKRVEVFSELDVMSDSACHMELTLNHKGEGSLPDGLWKTEIVSVGNDCNTVYIIYEEINHFGSGSRHKVRMTTTIKDLKQFDINIKGYAGLDRALSVNGLNFTR